MLHSNSVRGHEIKTGALAGDRPDHRWDVCPAAIRTLEINGSQWRSQKDVYDALSDLLGSVERHCRSSGAILETMIYYPYLNMEQPPYEIVIKNASAELKPFLFDFAFGVAEARQDRSASPKWGDDIEVVVTVA